MVKRRGSHIMPAKQHYVPNQLKTHSQALDIEPIKNLRSFLDRISMSRR